MPPPPAFPGPSSAPLHTLRRAAGRGRVGREERVRRRVARVDALRRVGERRLVEQVGELRARGLRREKEETSGFGDEESGRASELRIPEREAAARRRARRAR